MIKVRILFLADSHLGFDLPSKPKIKRRRRGIDFFKNYHFTLEPAFSKKVDLVIHGGDLFYRSRIPDILVSMAFEPLIKIADSGIPVLLIPGNHERSIIKQSVFELHKNIYIYNKLKNFEFNINRLKLNIAGFPCVRKNIRFEFTNILEQLNTKIRNKHYINLLCMHQAVEGAMVGVQNFTFRTNHDTIRAKDIPKEYSAIFSGHIHRHQVITNDLKGNPINCSVYYPGSIERTSFSERYEVKGYLIVELVENDYGRNYVNYEFVELPCRPMEEITITYNEYSQKELLLLIAEKCSKLNENSIVKLKLKLTNKLNVSQIPSIEQIRNITPNTLNISYRVEQVN